MVWSCVACKAKSGHKSISFHSFTKDEQLQKIWLENITSHVCRNKRNNGPFTISKHTKICSQHFNKSDFRILSPTRKALRKTAVPTRFAWTSPTPDKNNPADVLSTAEIKVEKSPTPPIEHILMPAVKQEVESDEITADPLHVESSSAETDSFKIKISELEQLVQSQRFTIDNFKQDDSKIDYYTGLPNYRAFESSLALLTGNDKPPTVKTKLTTRDQYFLVLIKYRHDFDYEHLSTLFKIQTDVVNHIFLGWTKFLFFQANKLKVWPGRDVLPRKTSTVVGGVIGAVKFPIQSSESQVKSVIVTSTDGAVVFVSPLIDGALSDGVLLQRSGLVGLVEAKVGCGDLEEGDALFADCEYSVGKFVEVMTRLNMDIPTFRLTGNSQFITGGPKPGVRNQPIDRLNGFKILAHEIPHMWLDLFGQIWKVCAILSNFSLPGYNLNKLS